MKRRRTWPLLVVGVVVLLALASWGFWSLGTLPAEADAALTVRIDQGTVEVQHVTDGSGRWSVAKNGESLAVGDRVRTGADGEATLELFGVGESRLAENSEVHVGSATARSSDHPFALDLEVRSGRLWSHVLRLLDLDDSFVVRANNVVATVRGTSFDVQVADAKTIVSVTEASVAVNGTVLSAGSMSTIDARGTSNVLPLPDQTIQSDWFMKNATRDVAFQRNAKQSLQQTLQREGGVLPGSAREGLEGASERLHLWLAGQRAEELYARYAQRHLYGIVNTIRDGKSGLGFQSYSALEEDMSHHLTSALKRRIGDITFLLEGTSPSDPLYRLKQKLEDFDIALAGSDQARISYARLLGIDARLDEAAVLIGQSSLDDAKNALDAASQGITNIGHDIDRLTTVSGTELQTLKNKLAALKARAVLIQSQLANASMPNQNATSTQMLPGVATSTAMTTSTSPIARIALRVSPNPLLVGSTAKLAVTATMIDGSKKDVTSLSTFTASDPSFGTLNGPTFASSAAGRVQLMATVADASSSIPVFILTPSEYLTSITMRAEGQTTLTAGGEVPLSITATMADGSTKDVTALAKFSVSDPSLGSMRSNVFVDSSSVPGTVQITATYTEAGILKRTTLSLTLQ